ncbi:MAG: hypothetical protein ACC658_05680 [Acidimicrobiia bacterium]
MNVDPKVMLDRVLETRKAREPGADRPVGLVEVLSFSRRLHGYEEWHYEEE